MMAPLLGDTYSPAALAACQQHLVALLNSIEGVTAAVLATTDGFEMASVTRGGIAPSRLAALASSLHALGQASLREIEIAGQAGVFIESLGGKILIEAIPHAGSDAVLCVVSKAETLAGKLLWACKQCAGQVAGELAS